jgi:hypothetical protein
MSRKMKDVLIAVGVVVVILVVNQGFGRTATLWTASVVMAWLIGYASACWVSQQRHIRADREGRGCPDYNWRAQEEERSREP